MNKGTCATCGQSFEYPAGRGRPRKYCDDHRVVDRRYTPAPREQTCCICGGLTTGAASKKYCSESCKWIAHPRLPCSDCGGPTGWRAGRTDLVSPRCLACRAEWKHGTRKGYRDGKCRCEECRRWNREQMADYSSAYRERTGRSLQRKYQKYPKRGSDWISRTARAEIYERDGWVCWLCGGEVDPTLHCNDSKAASLDHVIPRSAMLIPDHSPENLRMAHRGCNSRKGSHEPERIGTHGRPPRDAS